MSTSGLIDAEVYDPDVDATIGHNVFELMFVRRIKQNRMSQALGISTSVMGKKLRGETTWTAGQIQAAAECLDVEPGRLFQSVTNRAFEHRRGGSMAGKVTDEYPARKLSTSHSSGRIWHGHPTMQVVVA